METEREPTTANTWRRHTTTIAVIITISLIASLFASFYVQQEHEIYFWDQSTFWSIYKDFCTLAQSDPSTLLFRITSTIDDDYNTLAILPLVPVGMLYSFGRLPYILAIVDTYLLASVFALTTFVLRQVGQLRIWSSPRLFCTVSLAILSSHVLWIPALSGLPDVIGVVVASIILIINFAHPVTKHSMRRIVLTGFLLCVLVLLRRWYMYWVVGLFPAFILAQFVGTVRIGRDRSAWLAIGRWVFVAGPVFASALFVLGGSLLTKMVTIDYADIYSAYRSSSSLLQTATLFYAHFGLLDLSIAGIGLGLLVAKGATRAIGVFFIVQAAIMFVLFGRTQDPSVHHFYLFFPALAAGIGTVIVHAYTKINGSMPRILLIAACFAGLLGSSAQVLLADPSAGGAVAQALLPSVRFAPLKRNDLDQFDAMLLQAMAYRSVYVAASSHVINSSILLNGCRTAGKPSYRCDKILPVVDVDKRDGFPYSFFYAELVLTAVPVQYHLDPKGQRVVGMLTRDLENRTGVGTAFRRLDAGYKLDNGVTVHAFVRVRPNTSEERHALSSELLRFYPDKPATFSDTPVSRPLTTEQRLCARFPKLMRLVSSASCTLTTLSQP